MGITTGISWTTSTFNPFIGCTKVSPGCAHCYAERDNHRRAWAIWGPNGTRVRTSPENWLKPLAWDRAAAASGKDHFVFCASLADPFERFTGGGPEFERTFNAWRNDMFDLQVATPHLTWLLLTKRIENVKGMVPGNWLTRWPNNIWIGTTTENQDMANSRLPYLLDLPAPRRFVSVEPMLSPVTFKDLLKHAMAGSQYPLDWVIAGGESGAGYRTVEPDAFRSLRDECVELGIDFFFKQWGGTKKIDGYWGGNVLDGQIWSQRPAATIAA